MFPNGLLMAAFDETFGEDYNYHMDDVPGFLDNVLRWDILASDWSRQITWSEYFFFLRSFTIRREFSDPARNALLNIASAYRANNPNKFKKKQDITFVGIHQRRGDHITLREEHNINELGAR